VGRGGGRDGGRRRGLGRAAPVRACRGVASRSRAEPADGGDRHGAARAAALRLGREPAGGGPHRVRAGRQAVSADDVPYEPYNPPGQSELAWRVSPHGATLERLRAALADGDHLPPVRSLATRSARDPAVALLDAWAVVTDVVSFYTERVATE